MKKLIFCLGVVFASCQSQVEAQGTINYVASNFQSAGSPLGGSVTPMNLTGPGELVRITGSGLGGGDLTRDSIYVINPTPVGNQLWDIYRGQRVDGGGNVIYFGLLSWSDSEIDLEVLPGYGASLGSLILLRNYNGPDDHVGTARGGTLSLLPIPEPSICSLVLICGTGLISVFKRHQRIK